jgi:hypothetical protein
MQIVPKSSSQAAADSARSQPQDLLAQGEIAQQRLGGSLVRDGAALEHEYPIRQRQHQIEIVLDDHDRDAAAQPEVTGRDGYLRLRDDDN